MAESFLTVGINVEVENGFVYREINAHKLFFECIAIASAGVVRVITRVAGATSVHVLLSGATVIAGAT